MAAVLASGAGAALSHRSAASLWSLLPVQTGFSIDVSVPGRGGRKRRVGILLRRCPSLRPALVTRHRGIPVTTPARTISDLRRVIPPHEVRRALRQAAVLGLLVEEDVPHDGTRSELEFRFLELCRRHQLPLPEVNVRVGSLLVDFFWPDHRVVVETDGYRYHRGRVAFEDDRVRDLKLRALGYDVLRFTHRQVADNPEQVLTAVKKALSR
jgi:very-short-patch-repair endonuclease